MEMPKRKALGKGLEQLFSDEILDFDNYEKDVVKENKEEIVQIPISELRPNPYQPRKKFDEENLQELADSIEVNGVFQPIIVKKSIKGYEIIAGERRVRACKIANIDKIPAIVRDFDDSKMMEIALLENLQREDLNAIELGISYKRIMETKGISLESLSKIIGKSKGAISQVTSLLRLPENVQQMIIDGKMTPTSARELSHLNDVDKIQELASKIVNGELSLSELRRICSASDAPKPVRVQRTFDDKKEHYKHIGELMETKLNARSKVYNDRIEIRFKDQDDLARILDLLNIKE